MSLSKNALRALQYMMGEEGSFFLRDLPLNYYPYKPEVERCKISFDKFASEKVFRELKRHQCIECRVEGSSWEQWSMTQIGRQALKDAGMETKPGELTPDDLHWLTGTGHYAQ
ncbi:MAG: hypothetical protein HYT98_01880 [Candidatus Sungbacteria bacterium]|nr:hypothetical protein [Candidatus Sungbacteria bacterium]